MCAECNKNNGKYQLKMKQSTSIKFNYTYLLKHVFYDSVKYSYRSYG